MCYLKIYNIIMLFSRVNYYSYNFEREFIMPVIIITEKTARGFLCNISYSNATAFVRALAFARCSSRCLQWDWFTRPNAKSLSNSGMRERLVCTRIRSIRGTRLLPPDIEREFACMGPSASELILTCHSVMAYARSLFVSSLSLPVWPSEAS